MSERNVDISPHRFFRAMVLMGGGIALGCGGISDEPSASGGTAGSSASGGAGGTTGGSGGTGTSSGGSVAATGGTTVGAGGTTVGTGGTGNVGGGGTGNVGGGGTGNVGGGGTGNVGGGGTGNVSGGGAGGTGAGSAYGGTGGTSPGSTCSPSQWSCPGSPGTLECGVNSTGGYALPEDCVCDPTRPLSGADCASGRRVCLEATTNADGSTLPEVPFMCACAEDVTSCASSCHLAYPDGDGHQCLSEVPLILPQPVPPPTLDDFLCGCSYVFLK